MKIKFYHLILLLLVTADLFAAIDFYYYNNTPVQLQQRNDKIAVIIDNNSFNAENTANRIKSRLNFNDTVKVADNNVIVITLSSPGVFSRVNSAIQTLTGISGIKFITPTYYGSSRKVIQVPTDEFIVRLKNENDLTALNNLNTLNRCIIIGNVGDKKGFLIKSLPGVTLNALELSDIYYNSTIFEYSQPNFLYPDFCLLHYTPNDAFYTSQWALNNTGQSVSTGGVTGAGDATTTTGIAGADMRVSQAWDYTLGSSSIEIGVLDTGIDSTHPDFQSAGHLLAGYDGYYNTNTVPRDSGSHGTCTAGLIGAVTNNSLGTAGIAPNCKLMSLRVFNAAGSATDLGIARAFDTARVRGIDVLSNSWGGGTASSTITNAINSAATSGRGGLGCIILFSSGNDGSNPPSYPSYLDNVICVGASTTHDQKKAAGTGNQYWWGGNYGESVSTGDIECAAPTVCYTTDVQGTSGYNTSGGTTGNYYSVFNGTSCSCPNAAGVAALVLSVNTSQTRLQVTENLLRGCDKIDNVPYSTTKTYGKWNAYFGYGRINAYNSVRLAAGVDITPPSINHTNAASHNSTYMTLLTANITDQDGSSVPASGSNRPMVIYRSNKNNAGWSSFDSVYATSNSGNDFYFNIPCFGWETEVQYYLKAVDNSGNISYFPKGAPNSFWLCYFAVGSLTETTNRLVSWSPTDNAAVISPNINFGVYKILSTKVRIYLRHTWVSDIILYIWSPNGDNNNNRKCLFSENGGSLDNITGAIVSDSASQFWKDGTPPYTNGTYYPEITMRGYNGTYSSGNWRFLNMDIAAGDAPTYDSLRITFTRTSGTLSTSARVNSSADTTIDFGIIPIASYVDKNFYLKNSGNSNLTVSAVNFTGSYSANFSLLTSLPGAIVPGDSGLFTVRATSIYTFDRSSSSDDLDAANGNMVLTTNDPSKTNLSVTLLTDYALPVSLISFELFAVNRDVKLTWSTSEEQNNSGFDVQRQFIDKNGNVSGWNKAGFVQGNGNTTEIKYYSFTDPKPGNGKFNYRLKQIDYNGNYEFFNAPYPVEIGKPGNFDLSQNYPNPSNPVSSIDYQVPADADVNISVYDLTGRLVKMLVNSKLEAGYYTAVFDGTNIASGIYIYRITAKSQNSSFSSVKKLVLIK